MGLWISAQAESLGLAQMTPAFDLTLVSDSNELGSPITIAVDRK